MTRNPKSTTPWLVPALIAAAVCAGCASLAEDVATHLARQDVQAIDQDFTVVEGDLALFKQCLEKRGGSCPGDPATALPHSSQHHQAKPVTPVDPRGSKTLADSVDKLPPGHPAKIAHEVLSHPVTRQAAALHNHLRGHDAGSTPGVSVTQGQGTHGGPQSTVTMDLKLGQTRHFHGRLLSSLGTRAWDALHGHCRDLLKAHQGAPDFDRVATDRLAADCRRAAFVRGYLGAYLRHGEFVEVDVQLAGAIRAINQGAAKIEGDVQSVRDRLAKLEKEVAKAEKEILKDLAADAGKIADAVNDLVAKVDAQVSQSLGQAGAELTSALAGLAGQAAIQAGKLAKQGEAAVAEDVRTVAADLDGILEQIDTALAELQDEVRGFDRQLVRDIDDELDKADKALSNVFKVSKVGFLSRDTSFQARLPTIEVTLDPTARRLVTVTDRDTGQLLTTRSDFGHLGVATDTSGVGTGAAIGAELVRVFLEAIFDAHEGLPAVAPANLGGVKPTGLTLGRYSLPVFQSPAGNVDSHDLMLMSFLNDEVALKTRLLVGRIISGVGPFSLNNPPLEHFITEIVATSVRKAAEKASWCWYACNLDVELAKLSSDVGKAVEDKLSAEEKKLEKAIEAEEKKLEKAIEAGDQKAWTWVHREAEHVKLRLKLSK